MATDSPLTSGERRALRLGTEPAMPAVEVRERGRGRELVHHRGLSKRETFAMVAMQGMLARERSSHVLPEGTAKKAVEHADALLEELEK